MTISTPPTPPPWETEEERRRREQPAPLPLPPPSDPLLAGWLDLIELRLQTLSLQLSGLSARLGPCSLCRGEGCSSPTCGRGSTPPAP